MSAQSPPPSWTGRIFALSWLSYFSYYATRKNLSVAKTAIADEHGLSKTDLVHIDLGFLAAYMVGQFVHGLLADALGPRRLVPVGMLVSAAVCLGFGLAGTRVGGAVGVFALLWTLNGLVQASGWPGNGRLMASWFSTVRRGQIMGWWSTCYQAGGLAAGFAAAWLLGFGWRAAMIGPAVWVAVVAIAFFWLVRDRPSDVGFADPEVAAADAAERRRLRREAWPVVRKSPMTWLFGLTYFCLKSIRYAFLFWLPFYLNDALHFDRQDAGYMAQAFEVGGIPFVILAGIAADRWFGRRRVAVAAVCMVLLAGALFLYRQFGGEGALINVVLLMAVGAFLFGADSLVSGAVAQDLGGPHAAALACGMINGIGSLGPVVGLLLIHQLAWADLFAVFVAMSLLGVAPLVPYLKVRPR